jgi:sugar phosphate isomerase/epimerase
MTPKLGVQLYSVRDRFAQDPWGTLDRLAEIGFAGVETAFYDEDDKLPRYAARIRELEMEICGVHADNPVGEQRRPVLRQMEELGASRLVYHGGCDEDRFASRVGLEEFALELATGAKVAANRGWSFGVHTHWWDVRQVDGVPGYRVLDELLDPSIGIEVDVYWAQVGGADPAQVVRDLGERVTLLHMQDGPGDGVESPQVPLGHGVVDLPAVIAAATSAEWLVLEINECEGDVMDVVAESHRWLAEHVPAA